MLDYEQGTCNDLRTYYYYDKSDGVCRTFHYNGCGGNKNRFKTQQECINKCGEVQGTLINRKINYKLWCWSTGETLKTKEIKLNYINQLNWSTDNKNKHLNIKVSVA